MTANTYVAPTKFFPIINETISHTQATIWRRSIRQNVDAYGAVPGNVHVAGDMEFEATEDVVPYFLHMSRATIVKSGATDFTYTCTPNSNAQPAKTYSITIVKNAAVFGYVGCVVSSYTIRVDDGILMMRCSIIGSDEATQTLPTPTFLTVAPFGAGMYNIQIPTPTQIFTVDTFEFQVEDNATPEFRLKSSGRGAQLIRYGARNAQLSYSIDFFDKTEYDAYKALTSTSVSLTASKGANNSITLTLPAGYRDEYPIVLGGQGDLIRANATMQATFDNTTSRAYQVVVKTQENFTP